jgi:predicted dehydrogenase
MQRAAVIGLGDISKIHVPILQQSPGVELAAVCDIDESLQAGVPGVPFYTCYQEMLAKEQLDCVHICLPHYLHYPVTKDVVEAGIDVFCEKPLAINTAQALAFLELERAHPERKIGICFQNRFNESFEELRRMVESGDQGRVLGIKGIVAWSRPQSYYDLKPWRARMATAGGGVMINQAIHTLDLMQLLGGEIDTVRGSIDNLLDYDLEVEDTASARIAFHNGATGLFFATVAHGENCNIELEVSFERGKFAILDNALYRLGEDGRQEKLVEDARMPGEKFYYGASHIKLINRFYHCRATDSQAYVHVCDAVKSIQIIDAIRDSSSSKRPIEFN